MVRWTSTALVRPRTPHDCSPSRRTADQAHAADRPGIPSGQKRLHIYMLPDSNHFLKVKNKKNYHLCPFKKRLIQICTLPCSLFSSISMLIKLSSHLSLLISISFFADPETCITPGPSSRCKCHDMHCVRLIPQSRSALWHISGEGRSEYKPT